MDLRLTYVAIDRGAGRGYSGRGWDGGMNPSPPLPLMIVLYSGPGLAHHERLCHETGSSEGLYYRKITGHPDISSKPTLQAIVVKVQTYTQTGRQTGVPSHLANASLHCTRNQQLSWSISRAHLGPNRRVFPGASTYRTVYSTN